MPFVRALKNHFAAGTPLDKKTRAIRSAPQHDHPPKVVLGFMKASPLPKVKTLATLGAIAAGIYALKDGEAPCAAQQLIRSEKRSSPPTFTKALSTPEVA